MIDREILSELAAIVGEKNLLTAPDQLDDYSHDEFALTEMRRIPDAVIRPATTEQVARIVRAAGRLGVPLVPRGGGTGLCGGCTPVSGGIVVDTSALNSIIEIDARNFMAVLQAGVTLAQFYQALGKENLFFPPHPGDEHAMVGGLAATNAGGARAVKYGTIRQFIHGMEVVLADGNILNLGGKIMKNSTGYNLLQLMIGSEGTLGIITAVTLHVMPPRKFVWTLLAPYEDLAAAMNSVTKVLHAGIVPMALEFLEENVIRYTEDMLGKKLPCDPAPAYLMFTLDGSTEEEIEKTAEEISEICLAGRARDVLAADNPQKQADILTIRSQFYEALKPKTVEILDIVVPRDEIAGHAQAVADISARHGVWLPTYGHAADGNVHTHIMKMGAEKGAPGGPRDDWRDYYPRVREEIHRDARARGGLISGEHGIGLSKKEYLPLFLSDTEIELMRRIKKVFDPGNIMNPDKVLP